ncbi:alpha-amylase family glycosyl hydrolase [Hydrogenovibrio sp. 3SP14C1]|uniref:alpha-amylase family glycosyl hydrolase n=1 Tax=Hydrogenovibrio sp. 3SP14C1 TaxID=3038774 RepID=UPI0024168C23|nr:alpha-amylase family glycosyl hydrolase [Hydrogenovibrio sp. 3SP14C1]MDG4812703.1 alpha-amylase family glycosyl hydrolase [Hydrogenovibrio sp. 3SP14C1]
MYEQISHSLLNDILNQIKPDIYEQDLRHFYTRLGANFYAIHSLFERLYGNRPDFKQQSLRLVETMARQYIKRPDKLKDLDIERENDYNWFLSQEWVGMALYSNGFANDLKGMKEHLSYFQELGVNLVHIMPIMKCPEGRSDGGYAISDFREIDERIGTLEDLNKLSSEMQQRDLLLVLDVVLNHTSDEHEWAQKARAGDPIYQDYYYTFDSRNIPDMFEQSMLEVFPETAPGNFTWNEDMQRWVMTVFNDYQWDLNYSNPAVFIEMLDVILFWANQGADILRLDAVAFLWKKIGSTCQNEHEAHLILQLLKDCCQVTAPGVLFIAEAIVAPVEVTKYFGEDAVIAKECEIAYNATFMALMWDAVATKNAKLLNQGIKSLPVKLERATWLNYVRCHDDIGLGFDDKDIIKAGYEPNSHRRFLIDYLTGKFDGSHARGLPFGENAKTGDARISGSLASLVGLQYAMETGDIEAIEDAVKIILLLHSMILSFGGIPLLYYGDEIGTLNDDAYLSDPNKMDDNRWVHRPNIDWEKTKRRNTSGTVEYQIFSALKKMIAVRKEIQVFSDFNNRELIEVDNPNLFVISRFDPHKFNDRVLVVANFNSKPQSLNLEEVSSWGSYQNGELMDLHTRQSPEIFNNALVVPGFGFYWLYEM